MVNLLFLVLLLMVLLSVAFFTLMERKLLGFMQLRKGPNKNSVLGIFQPLADGMKLFLKNNFFNFSSNKYLFQIFPLMGLSLMFMLWLIFNFLKMEVLKYTLIYFMMISSMSVYSILGSGWASNSKYGLLGAYRSVSQVVSYEVGLVFIIMLFMMFNKNMNLKLFVSFIEKSHSMFYGLIIVMLIWFVIILAELNRSPFDFSESESELVSGFNVEFGGAKFAFLFLSEYGSMLLMSYISMHFFFMETYIFMMYFMILMVWVRGTFPRFRYDNLMYLNWKVYLPVILYFFILICFFLVICV